MTLPSEGLLAAAKVVKLSGRDYKFIIGLLVAAIISVCGITYAMASSIVAAKSNEIKASADKIVTIESKQTEMKTDQALMKTDLANYSKRMDEILVEVRGISKQTNDIAVSVGTIQGRLTAPK